MPSGAGRLNKRVTFQRENQVPDGRGGFTRTWGSDLTVWAAMVPGGGSEVVAASRLQEISPSALIVRSSMAMRTVDATWRVQVDNQYWQVRSTSNVDQRNRFITINIEGGVGT